MFSNQHLFRNAIDRALVSRILKKAVKRLSCQKPSTLPAIGQRLTQDVPASHKTCRVGVIDILGKENTALLCSHIAVALRSVSAN